MFSSRSSAELQTLMEQVAHLVLWQGYDWTDHVLRRAWIDHNQSGVTLRCEAPFHDVLVEDFAHEKWSSGQLFKLVRDALHRAEVGIEEIDLIFITLESDDERMNWRRDANDEWFMRVEAQATARLCTGAEVRGRQTRDRLVPNVMLLSEGLDAQPFEERRQAPPRDAF